MLHANELADRIEIADLINRLGSCLDEHRFDDINALIAEDATALTPGGIAEGRSAVIAQATRNHERYARIQHLITNLLIDLNGDSATARANLHGTFVDADGNRALELGAIYRFQATRTSDDWQLTRIEVTPVWRKAAA